MKSGFSGVEDADAKGVGVLARGALVGGGTVPM
jgi:hypothetical protein